MTDHAWRCAIHRRHLRERAEVAEAANRVLMGALKEAVWEARRRSVGVCGDTRDRRARDGVSERERGDER